MKKAMLGFVAAAMSLLATTVNAGDIRSIDPCDEYGNVIDNGTMEQPHIVGETVYFRIRLENLNSRECHETRNTTTNKNPWQLVYDGLSLQPQFEFAFNPPKIGVYVSGQLRGAEIKYPFAPDGEGWYTDIICSYTVRPGDLALPMTLANSSGKEVGTGDGAEYYFDTIPKSGVWRLAGQERVGRDDPNTPENEWNQVQSVRDAVLKFGNELGSGSLPSQEIGTWTRDFNLRQAGLYLKSIDFASSEYVVAQGQTEKIAVNIEGGINTNGNSFIYAMVKSEDDSLIELAENTVETLPFEVIENGSTNTVNFQIAKVTIPSGADASSFSFKVRGLKQDADKTETIYLTTTKGFSYGMSGDLITNFVTAVVKCVAPPPPFIEVTLDGAARKTVTSSNNYDVAAAKLTVTLSEAYSSDFSVDIKAMLNGEELIVGTDYVGMSIHSESDFTGKNTSVNFTAQEMAAGILSKNLYVYVLGGNEDTAAIDKGIKFIPEAKNGADSFFNTANKSATLFINRSTPVILSPEEDSTHPEISGGVETPFVIKIADDYMNIKSEYVVEWWNDGAGETENLGTQKFTPNSQGEITVRVTYIGEGEHTTKFRVRNASGSYSAERHFIVPVRKAKTVQAKIIEAPDSSGKYLENMQELNIRFTLSEPYKRSTQPLYAYLIPWNNAASNQVQCSGTAFTDGVPFLPGQTISLMDAPIKILDGISGTLLRFKVMLSASEINNGNLTEGFADYTSQDLFISIANKAPVVSSVEMSGSLPVTASGSKFTGKASIGLKKEFRLVADDVEADLSKEVTVAWNISDPNGYLFTTNMTGILADMKLEHVFEVAGIYDCNVKIKDKDMSASEFSNLAPFEFKVEVSPKPMLLIEFPTSNTFLETDALTGKSYFDVKLSAPASRQIEVEVTCEGTPGSKAVLHISNPQLTFRAGQISQRVFIDEMDGTLDSSTIRGGFAVTAKVTTETTNDDGVKWCDAYEPTTEKMYVRNAQPKFITPSEYDFGVTNLTSIGVDVVLEWYVDDVESDLNNNLTVELDIPNDKFVTNGNDVAKGSYTTRFKSSGVKEIRFKVKDKDGAEYQISKFYQVQSRKQLSVQPVGPYKTEGETPLSTKYVTAANRGAGRAWAEGSGSIVKFEHEYSFDPTTVEVKLYANGYLSGEEDSAINVVGNSKATGDASYKYTDSYDSFFYGWISSSVGEDGSEARVSLMVSPSIVKDSTPKKFTLPTENVGSEENPIYLPLTVEAFFAKEKYLADNMGDLNNDGIPDYYATKDWSTELGESKSIAEAMTGVAVSTGGEGEESATASDLADVRDYNGDNDFFPIAWSFANPLNPSVKNWGPGLPFTALDEIRGIGPGLNQPGVSEYDLTEAERYALIADFVAAGNVASGTEEENYVAATNWATSVGWTPEAIDSDTRARLNPLKADTDGDGFNDGWEYFFWYHARIGAVVDGKWSRLEGRRFNPKSPAGYDRIAPEEIVQAFNPHERRATVGEFVVDFDNDGLSDFEEYVLGTNPISFDENNDSVIELYKVMNGIVVNSEFNNDGNPDCDFMARIDYEDDTFEVYTFENGEMYALPTKSTSAPVLVPTGATTDVYKVKFASGEVSWFTDAPSTYPGTNSVFLAADAVGFTTLTYDKTDYLGEEKKYVVGTEITSVATNTVAMHKVLVKEFSWINPATTKPATTLKALPLFNYGYDGVTYVPCVTAISQYALIPSDAALVKIEKDKTITLIHNQVYNALGFDPRTAWNSDSSGYVDQRWRKGSNLGDAGRAMNTVPYTTRDEYFVMQYRRELRAIEKDGSRSKTKSMLNGGDKYLLANLEENMSLNSVSYLQMMTTYPNLPVSFISGKYADKPELDPFATTTNKTITTYWTYLNEDNDVHGADTDFDGIPDGWELYINADPTNTDDAKLGSGWAKDGDGLVVLEEYAGVDSCNAYTNRFNELGEMIYPEAYTITKNHPGKDKGWWNKFFPTDPLNGDTDGDRISDDAEGKEFDTNFSVGTEMYGTVKVTFIYSDDKTAEKYAADSASTCFRGGGLNPCTVDTDGDLLPDPWEMQFAGVLFPGGKAVSKISPEDVATLKAADGKQDALTNDTVCIRGGMDGTFDGDANFDFDHDGLVNCQEYLVQSLRHLRYDDSLTPLMGLYPDTKEFVGFIPFSSWDGEAFHARCLAAGYTGLGTWQFRKLGYFALPPCEWDKLRQNTKGKKVCASYADWEGAGYRVMLPPETRIISGARIGASGYASTDPRRVDTDFDGMDDYWEIFHGLNPLLGSLVDPMEDGEYGWSNLQYDKIAEIYGGLVSAWCNHWNDWSNTQPDIDPIKHPWMMGAMEADADGDGLRNDEEALKVNLANPRNTHTDPTPLWMTDSSGKASYVAQYYNPDPYIANLSIEDTEETDKVGTTEKAEIFPDLLRYPWEDISATIRLAADGMGGASRNWMFPFEENEGFDTDHDFRRDATELTRGVEMTSDPQKHTDLDRRQALYFPGEESAAVSYGGEFRRSVSTEPDLLKQFTVECWVKPDGNQAGDVTILERVCDYGLSTLSNNTNVIRANFRIGINAEGHVYAEFEGSDHDSGSVRVTDRNKIVVDKWTHIAFRYDGKDAHLHINGEIAPVASVTGAGLLPANGIYGQQQRPNQIIINLENDRIKFDGGSVIPLIGYRALPCATVLGASIVDSTGFGITEETTWEAYAQFFKGWIDEVRIWDGARTSAEIHDSYKRAFTMEDIKQMRSTGDFEKKPGVFEQWVNGARRSTVNVEKPMILPAELLQHYSFSTLPGGVEPGNTITEPTGFRAGVLDNIRTPSGKALTVDTVVGWWYNSEVKSKVYSNYHIVPWIPNTVAHLPHLDGSTPDSKFWATGIAGVDLVENMGLKGYEFPNTANPYSYYSFNRDRYNYLKLLGVVENLGDNIVSKTSLYAKWLFELRHGFVGTSDLVPLGNAFAKIDSSYWDGEGAMDAWTDTRKSKFSKADSDGDGIPDWAEALGLVTAEDYLRALAAGLQPDGTTNSVFESVVDANFDGVKDWWQKMYGLAGSSQEDTDKDGLADFAEYLVSELLFKDCRIDPLLPRSDSKEFDYFRKPNGSKLYLGEMFSDHDFMEDHLEREYSEIGAAPVYYDAHLDKDDDGWSNWAEIRTKYDMGTGLKITDSIDTNVVYVTYTQHRAWTNRVEELLADKNRTQYEIIDLDFDITGYSEANHTDIGDGYIKYYKFTPKYGETYLYTGVPQPNVEMTVHYNGVKDLTGEVLTVEAYSDSELTRPDAIFTVEYGSSRNLNKCKFRYPEFGNLREGMNTFVVSIAATNLTAAATTTDTNNTSVLMGVVRNVDVGWKNVKFEVELKETSPICERGAIPSATNGVDKVYIYRYMVDGIASIWSKGDKPILVKDMGNRTDFHEGDLLPDTWFDLDWDDFESEVLDHTTISFNDLPVTNVVYRMYPREIDISNEAHSTNGTPYVEIVREFGKERIKPTPVSPGEDTTIYYGGMPTFRWKAEGDRPDTYTAFAIRVSDASGEIWNSGTQMLPPRNSDGEYVWTAPLYIGDQTSLRKIFASRGNFTWSVTMYNAKFQDDSWSDERKFRVNLYNDDEPNNSQYYTLNATVKYFGPAKFDDVVANTIGKIRVEAFRNPDFSGLPAGRTIVTNIADVAKSGNEINVKIRGLEAGDYYVRAYIDSDGDFKRSAWESWGYACTRGDKDTGAIYAPSSVKIGDTVNPIVATVYIEDADVDQDALPDVWEYDEANGAEDFLLKKGPMDNKIDGYIAVNPELSDDIKRAVAANGGASLMSLAASGYMPSAMASLMLGVDSVEPQIEEGTVGITSFSLEGDTVKLTVGAKAEDPLAGTIFISNGKPTATVVVLHATDLAKGFAPIKTVDVTFDIDDGAVSHTESLSLKKILGDDIDLTKGFFKVELK